MTFFNIKEIPKVEIVKQVAELVKYSVIQNNSKFVKRSWIAETWTEMHKEYDVPKHSGSGCLGTDRVTRTLKVLERAGILERVDLHVRITNVQKLLDCCDGKLSLTDDL